VSDPKRHSRFRNLERTRREHPAEKPASSVPSRFDALEHPAAEQPAIEGSSPGSAVRFREPAQTLELASRDPADQPFVRCARCEADSNAHAVRCERCGSDLQAPEQRAFNESLWRARREEAAREAAELEGVRAARAQADAEEGRRRLELTAGLAREVAEATRRRLDADEDEDAFGRSWRYGRGLRWDPLLRLLWRAPAPVRVGLLIAVVAVPAALIAMPRLKALGVVVAIVAIVAIAAAIAAALRWRR